MPRSVTTAYTSASRHCWKKNTSRTPAARQKIRRLQSSVPGSPVRDSLVGRTSGCRVAPVGMILEGNIMRSHILILSAWLAAISAGTCIAAEESSVKKDAKDVGHSVGDLARDVGHSAKKTAKAVGHGARDVTRTVGHAVRDGAKETKKVTKREAR